MCDKSGCEAQVSPAKHMRTHSASDMASMESCLASDFNAHMLGQAQGSGSGARLNGCHSLFGKTEGQDYSFDQEVELRYDEQWPSNRNYGIYRATVRIRVNRERNNDPIWSDYTISYLFPDKMCMDCIRKATALAFMYYHDIKNNTGVAEQLRKMNTGIDRTIKWAGRVRVNMNRTGDKSMMVGAVQTGIGEKIRTSCPAVGNCFH